MTRASDTKLSEELQTPSSRGRSGRSRLGRRWVFRIASILLGLSFFVVAEVLCIALDWGRLADYEDPFVGFSAVHPLFVLDDTGERYEVPKSRLKFFAPESFPAKKSLDTFRIFCLGGSVLEGNLVHHLARPWPRGRRSKPKLGGD